MKLARCLLPVLLLAPFAARAGEPEFPGLKAIMSEADWQRAKLDRLDPADLRLIDEAFVRFLKDGASQQREPVAVNEPAPAPEKKRSLWDRFGLPAPAKKAPGERPAMHAKVLAWRGTNGFVLDNGQVWQGIDPIRDELVGREIEIKEGRFGSFLLVVAGVETTVRLHRVK